MWEEIVFKEEDSIAVIAPHPDDESLGTAGVLLLAPEKTDVFVLTDGSHGNPTRSKEEEAAIRKQQFEAVMEYVKPRTYFWFGYEDSLLDTFPQAVCEIDFTNYTKIFLPWQESLHCDHRAAAAMCMDAIRQQNAKAECYSYEVTAPFRDPTHYIDISDLAEQKRKMICFHKDQIHHERIALSLNAFRAAQMVKYKDCNYAETYIKIRI